MSGTEAGTQRRLIVEGSHTGFTAARNTQINIRTHDSTRAVFGFMAEGSVGLATSLCLLVHTSQDAA
jgi:hypothetical protein